MVAYAFSNNTVLEDSALDSHKDVCILSQTSQCQYQLLLLQMTRRRH